MPSITPGLASVAGLYVSNTNQPIPQALPAIHGELQEAPSIRANTDQVELSSEAQALFEALASSHEEGSVEIPLGGEQETLPFQNPGESSPADSISVGEDLDLPSIDSGSSALSPIIHHPPPEDFDP